MLWSVKDPENWKIKYNAIFLNIEEVSLFRHGMHLIIPKSIFSETLSFSNLSQGNNTRFKKY